MIFPLQRLGAEPFCTVHFRHIDPFSGCRRPLQLKTYCCVTVGNVRVYPVRLPTHRLSCRPSATTGSQLRECCLRVPAALFPPGTPVLATSSGSSSIQRTLLWGRTRLRVSRFLLKGPTGVYEQHLRSCLACILVQQDTCTLFCRHMLKLAAKAITEAHPCGESGPG